MNRNLKRSLVLFVALFYFITARAAEFERVDTDRGAPRPAITK